MISKKQFLEIGFVLAAFCAQGQGTFVYDQQSSTDETPVPGAGPVIQQYAPYGQSFTPLLSSVSFIRLKLSDQDPATGVGATLVLNLRADSLSGVVLGTSTPVVFTNGFAGTVNFLFTSPVPVTPGATYLFETIVQSGDLWNIDASEYNYPGGSVFYNGGLRAEGSDVWFREGIIVPEPSSALLVLAGSGLFMLGHKKGRLK